MVAVYKRYKSEQFIDFSFSPPTPTSPSSSNSSSSLRLVSSSATQSVITFFVFLGLELTEQIGDIFFFSYKYSVVQKQHGEGKVRVRGGKEALAGRQRDSCGEQIDCEIKEILNYN